jgi:nicotinamidase-related amidase
MQSLIHLLVIDAQNDFCDLPSDYVPQTSSVQESPALPVAGAHADMQRLSEMMQRGLGGLSDISITLDSHHHIGIERPTFWMKGDGSAVSPFTQILAADVRAGKYVPRNPAGIPRVLQYLDALEAAGRYTLMVWPVHCEIGTWGYNVHRDVRKAYNAWEERELGVVQKVTKGSNPWTEHYSALMAEVPDPKDATTHLNSGLIQVLEQADLVPIAGEAGSHCVKATVEHIADNFGPENLKKLVLLTDCISPVTGFEQQYKDFLADMSARGLQLATSVDFLPELVTNSRK